MKVALIGAALAWAALAGSAMSEDSVQLGTVVELYTSQGCSSCPPADDYMADLAQRPGVIALSLHVDYWDYIGWADSFAQSRFTDRQKAYARAEGSRTIYTPQMIVGGHQRIEGVDPEAVESALTAQPAPALTLRLDRQGDLLTVSADPLAGQVGPLRLQLVRYIPRAEVMIEAGENAGRRVDYFNVVTSWSVMGEWDGIAPLQMTTELTGPEPYVVILQAEGPGPILAAAASR